MKSWHACSVGGVDSLTFRMHVVQGWWSWYLWLCPVFWSCWGLVTTQLGDVKEMMTLQDGTVTQVSPHLAYTDICKEFLGAKCSCCLEEKIRLHHCQN